MSFRHCINLLVLSASIAGAQEPPNPNPNVLFERTKAATVIVLGGEGAGRLKSIATGVIISKDGVLLTALHAIKGAAEVQVRTADGEVYDHVKLLGSDDRRDVAALKISAGDLKPLTPGNSRDLAQGDPVYAVTNADGLAWSATEGIYSATRTAEEIGAGSGFHLLQFTAPIAPGSSGGALVDHTGALVGIITRGNGTAAFAVPIENVLGLPDSGPPVPSVPAQPFRCPRNLMRFHSRAQQSLIRTPNRYSGMRELFSFTRRRHS
jgi:S1-C subfamily serine protease